MTKKTTSTLLALAALGAGVAGCGSSSTTAAGVQTAPSAGATAAAVTTATSSSTTSSATATVPTPSSGALSKEPKVTPPKGPAPKSLKTVDLIKGTGAAAKPGSTVTVNYVGVLYKNGKVFDASWKRHQTFTTPLATSSVIPGWVQGIPGMRVGGRRMLIIPPKLGYGSSGQGPIPANSTLVFVVDLLKVS